MPELPEVETTRLGIEPHVLGRTIQSIVVRQPALRWPIPPDLPVIARGQRVSALDRRGKYLLMRLETGTLILHLGMSGSLRVCEPGLPPRKHDHVDLVIGDDAVVRFHDPRRFGCLLWTEGDPLAHPLIAELGPEPFEPLFSGAYLHRATRGRTIAVKPCIMDAKLVVGVGNIYANEALFRAGIHPLRAVHRISVARYDHLAAAIRDVLAQALAAGGTTLRDFVNERGAPGYFQQTLQVYGRGGEGCRVCNAPIHVVRSGQRSTFFCANCQR